MAISEGYGQKGNSWYVNSGQGWSRDKVDEMFVREARPDGSVPLAVIETLVGSADLVGLWAIRSYIEGKGCSRSTTQTIMRDYPMQDAKGVPYTWQASLNEYLDARRAVIREGQLQRAGKAAAHLLTNPSSGSIIDRAR